jgi:(p)ppGpp synthase/HD superfamily hydrolase
MIHTDIGNNCIGALVNNMIKPLDYQLQNGEIVEILIKKGRIPNPAWLDFVRSTKAKDRIRAFINKKRETSSSEKGGDEIAPKKSRETISIRKNVERTKPKIQILIGGERNIPLKIPSCCNPLPGQSLVAYKSRGLFFTIHKANCSQLKKLNPERFLEAHFITSQKLEIKALDRFGFSRDCTAIIAEHGLNIGELSSRYLINKENQKIVTWNLSVEIRSQDEFQKLIKDLHEVPNVLSIKEKK